MIRKLVDKSNLDWRLSSVIPKLHNKEDKWISDDLILLFDDGFIVRGYYVSEEGWFGYESDMSITHYISDPKYYITI